MIVPILQEADTKILNAPFTPSGEWGRIYPNMPSYARKQLRFRMSERPGNAKPDYFDIELRSDSVRTSIVISWFFYLRF